MLTLLPHLQEDLQTKGRLDGKALQVGIGSGTGNPPWVMGRGTVGMGRGCHFCTLTVPLYPSAKYPSYPWVPMTKYGLVDLSFVIV